MPHVVAETVVRAVVNAAGNEPFRIPAGDLLELNKGTRQIALTALIAQGPTNVSMAAPVAQRARARGHVIQFAMPREWAPETVPEPVDTRVTLRSQMRRLPSSATPGRGRRVVTTIDLTKLRATLEHAGPHWQAEPEWPKYDHPLELRFLRRGENWLEPY
jgi:hypothetical protein